MTWLALAWFISIGTLNINDAIGPAFIQTPPSSFEATISGKLEAFDDHVELGGSVMTGEAFRSVVEYYPFVADYGVFVKLKYGPLAVLIDHHCVHPVLNDNAADGFPFQEGRTTVAVELHGITKLF